MCHTRGLDHPGAFQFNWFCAQVVEISDTLSEQDGHQVDAYFVNQPGLDALLHNIRAVYRDILVAGDRSGLFNGAFNAVRDERER